MPTLVEYLEKHYPDSSKRTLKNWIKWGRVRVDGKRPKGWTFEEGQHVEVVKRESFVLYSDKWLVAIDKPAGMLSVPDHTGVPSALDRLREQFGAVYPVHRLDRDASGVLLFARTLPVKKRLGEMFRDHALEREYLATVEGRVEEAKGTFSYPLLELDSYDVVVSDEGRRSITHFERVKTFKHTTQVRVRLETGRKHQIRVHFSHYGHPIVGDRRYGASNGRAKRLALHAERLAFSHPITRRNIVISSVKN